MARINEQHVACGQWNIHERIIYCMQDIYCMEDMISCLLVSRNILRETDSVVLDSIYD